MPGGLPRIWLCSGEMGQGELNGRGAEVDYSPSVTCCVTLPLPFLGHTLGSKKNHNGNAVIMEDRGYNDGGSSGNGSDNNSSDNGGDSGHSDGYGFSYGYGYGYDPKKLPGVRLCAMRDRQERLPLSLFGINIARQVSPNLLPENNGMFFS